MSDACRSFQDVHDVHSQFLIAVADACQSAAVASFAVEVLLTSGEWVAGVPEPVRPDFGEDQVEETGYANELSIDGGTMRLDEIVACTILVPGGFGSPEAP